MAAPLYLICGATGAGKTTYARRLAAEIGAIRFSIDEWMSRLFWMDAPQPIEPTWPMERIKRCKVIIWETAVEAARQDVPCLLEVGLNTRAARQDFATRALAADLEIRLHFIDVPADERWRRVETRNADKANDQLGFAISREMFDFVESQWEPPSDEELRALDGIRMTA